ncbi:MAG TPA: hypothetical protein PKO41_02280 [Dokdonella sp.]|uniref:hypothetical protein n=1 Tax=Dokdonella sp. TaxID=2291710 RepID=UPI0025C6E714|nr:hypothetical protein [Dokdonella sp.]MBX3692471.1 hypothetical protein [Dokdonella sp.]MCW5567582.1 hypothetical protein [Dokdonella sp.]HNR91230.1 hypothetical protein [Dokdonella sp.]
MLKLIGWWLCLLWLPGLFVFHPAASFAEDSAQKGAVVMDSQAIDAGVVFPLADLEVSGRLINTTTTAIKIVRIAPRTASRGDEVVFTPALLQPGQSMDLKVKTNLGEHVGRFSLGYFAFSDDQAAPVAKVVVRGFVDWIVDPESTRFDAGIVKAGAEVRHEFAPVARPGVDVRYTEVDTTAGTFSATISADGRSVTVFSVRKLPWGPFDERVVVRTDNPSQPKVSFRVFGQIRGAVVPSQESIQYGLIREGETTEQIVRLTDATGRALEVGNVSVAGAHAQVKVEQCVPPNDSCRHVRVSMLGPKIGTSELRGVVKIEFPDYGEVLPIAFGAALIGKNTVIQDPSKAMEESRTPQSGLSSLLRASTVRSRPVEMPVPEGRGPLLSWETVDEGDVYGYEVYRSSSERGVFERVNREIIKKISEDPAVGSIYRWRDTQVGPGIYWYYIGTIKLNGSKAPLNSPSKVIVRE